MPKIVSLIHQEMDEELRTSNRAEVTAKFELDTFIAYYACLLLMGCRSFQVAEEPRLVGRLGRRGESRGDNGIYQFSTR